MERTLNVPAGGQVQQTLNVAIAPDAPAGPHTLKVGVVYGEGSAERDLTVTVTPLWTIVEPVVDPSLLKVKYSNGRFLALSALWQTQRLQDIWISADGRTWSRVSIDPGESRLSDIAYDGSGTYLAVGPDSTVLQSQDGQTWSRVNTPFSRFAVLTSVVYAAGKWVLGSNYGIHLYDGTDWQTIVPTGQDHALDDALFVAYGNGKFVVAGRGVGSNQSGVGEGLVIYTSEDGVTWRQTFFYRDPYYSTAYPRSLIYDAEEGRFLLAGDTQGNISQFFVFASPDGNRWQPIHGGGLPVATRVRGLAFGSGTYLLIIERPEGPVVYSINPGVSGERREPISGIFSLAYGNSQFIGVGTSIAIRQP
ncbi:hypothetical protein [Thermus sp. LT1-2-5]|uniref:WD40/YVTN/BNR-like repeat-containing protein n=1 Tax=Thermus sp. LT1-2-5 TaxID=3026935 RepID=UPI0033659AE8